MKSKALHLLSYAVISASILYGTCASISSVLVNSNSETVNLIAGNGVGSMISGIRKGARQWNESSCVDFYNPTPYPHFWTGTPINGAPQILVERFSGFRLTSGTSTCGVFSAVPGSSSAGIRVYTMGRAANGQEYTCGLDDPERVSDLIAHEVGHYLNLANSPCETAIMGTASFSVSPAGTTWDNSRRVLTSECSLADMMSFTPYEEEERDCQSDPEPCTGTSPILIDLDRNSFHLASGPVFFDIDNDGEEEAISWTEAGQKDAFLCLDRNGNGIIDDGSELFGDATRMDAGNLAAHGYLALAEFDEGLGGNFDGKLTPEDLLFEDLCVWLDDNQNGFSEPDELQTLSEAGVLLLDLHFRVHQRRDQIGNEFRYVSTAFILDFNGQVKKTNTADVFFVGYD